MHRISCQTDSTSRRNTEHCTMWFTKCFARQHAETADERPSPAASNTRTFGDAASPIASSRNELPATCDRESRYGITTDLVLESTEDDINPSADRMQLLGGHALKRRNAICEEIEKEIVGTNGVTLREFRQLLYGYNWVRMLFNWAAGITNTLCTRRLANTHERRRSVLLEKVGVTLSFQFDHVVQQG